FSSTLTFATLTEPDFSRAISSSNGAIILQGPHHSAQKSTITGLSSCFSSRSKLDSSSLITEELSIALGKISPNLNNQNHRGNTGMGDSRGGHWIRTVSRDIVVGSGGFCAGGGAKEMRVGSCFGSLGAVI